MLDLAKIKAIKFIGYILLLVLAVVIGVGVGQSITATNTKKEDTEQKEAQSAQVLTQDQVKEFLLNYYTKKDLGENRNRYKDYMTDGLYKQQVAKEEEAVNQTYKGFVIDYKFQSAEIYINQEKLQVITQVNYVNTLLDDKKNLDTAQKDVLNKKTLRLSYINDNGTLKVNKIESIILTDQTGDYGILDSSKPSEEQSKGTGEQKKETN
ncbi:hypothetical protein NML69_03715 [Streptococcus sp. CF8-6]|uniref:hypothetical protein n=1 Tax=Streptococcus sp. CF8-6 TaxID=2963150 RepID=UPI0020C8C086|nr:hypothetical protein [Streptococcus sp. CF8-6]MCP9017085.1 hypothetical protein [Streptococcus sp. CF8-6]